MNEEHIYVVTGSTGEHDDWCDWNVAATPSKEDAEGLVITLNKWLEENGVPLERGCRHRRDIPECPLDPQLKKNYYSGGVEYGVEEVRLI